MSEKDKEDEETKLDYAAYKVTEAARKQLLQWFKWAGSFFLVAAGLIGWQYFSLIGKLDMRIEMELKKQIKASIAAEKREIASISTNLLQQQVEAVILARSEAEKARKASEDGRKQVETSLKLLAERKISFDNEVRRLLSEMQRERSSQPSSLSKSSREDSEISRFVASISDTETPEKSGVPLADLIATLAQESGDESLSNLARAQAAAARGANDEAITLATEARHQSSEPNSIFDILIAQSYYEKGEFDKAISSFEDALKLAEDDSERNSILSNLGAASYAMAEDEPTDSPNRTYHLKRAAEYEAKARALSTDNPIVYANSAVTLNALGESEEALRVLNQFTGVRDDTLKYAFASTYALIGMGKEAIAALESISDEGDYLSMKIALDPDFEKIRSMPEFNNFLEERLGTQLLRTFKEMWTMENG